MHMDQLRTPARSLQTVAFAFTKHLSHLAREYRKKRKIIAFIVLFVGYFAGTLISHAANDFISSFLLWPSAGIALAILFLEGADLWPAIFLASLITSLMQGLPVEVAVGLAASNSLENFVGAQILRRTNFSPILANLRDVIIFILVSVSISFIGPTLGSLFLYTYGTSLSSIEQMWGPWWLGKMLSHLVFGAFILRWFIRFPLKRTKSKLFEWALAYIFLIFSSYIVFWTPWTHAGSVPLIYLVLIPLIWMSLSIGPRGVTLGLFSMTAISIAGVLFGHTDGVQTALQVSTRLVQVEVFNAILTVIFLIFVSSEEGRKLASNALREHILQLESALHRISSEDRAKNEFLAILAHELRNPLAPILSSLELMRLPHKDPKEQERLLDTMDDRVRTMARLLDDLLDISRISQKKFKLQKETVDLNTVLTRSVETALVLMQSKKHTLRVTLLDEPVWISGDPVRLEQIVINLLNNAAKYTEPEGTISLRAERAKDAISICVKDSGIGIPHDMLSQVFEPFLQVEQARHSQGLGIGLSLAKRLTEMHQGTIEARSEGIGRGSEFIVRLPVAPVVQLPIPMTDNARENHHSSLHSFNIFLVDDNKLAAEGLGKLMAHKGHTVTLAYDAAEALVLAPPCKPDVIILDIGLPDMDGYTLARLLKASGLSAFYIALTGYGQEEDKLKARQAGFDHHLTKPVGIADIEAILASLPPPQTK